MVKRGVEQAQQIPAGSRIADGANEFAERLGKDGRPGQALRLRCGGLQTTFRRGTRRQALR